MATRPAPKLYAIDLAPSDNQKWNHVVLMTFPGAHRRVWTDEGGKPYEFSDAHEARRKGQAAMLDIMNAYYHKSSSDHLSLDARKQAEKLFEGMKK